MKVLTGLAGLAIAFASQGSFAASCSGISLAGEVQIVPLDGTATVIGRISGIEELFGGLMNPIKAEPQSDGSVALNVYETVIPTHLGQKVGDSGTIQFSDNDQNCTLTWNRSGKSRQLELVGTPANGDLILSDIGTPAHAPNLVIKKVSK